MLNYKAIGRKIAHHRKISFLTQAALAEKLGISESYLSQVECGKVEISLKRLNHIAETLNVNLIDFLSDTNTESQNYGNSELLELIKCWPPEQTDILLTIIKCVNDQICPTSKRSDP